MFFRNYIFLLIIFKAVVCFGAPPEVVVFNKNEPNARFWKNIDGKTFTTADRISELLNKHTSIKLVFRFSDRLPSIFVVDGVLGRNQNFVRLSAVDEKGGEGILILPLSLAEYEGTTTFGQVMRNFVSSSYLLDETPVLKTKTLDAPLPEDWHYIPGVMEIIPAYIFINNAFKSSFKLSDYLQNGKKALPLSVTEKEVKEALMRFAASTESIASFTNLKPEDIVWNDRLGQFVLSQWDGKIEPLKPPPAHDLIYGTVQERLKASLAHSLLGMDTPTPIATKLFPAVLKAIYDERAKQHPHLKGVIEKVLAAQKKAFSCKDVLTTPPNAQ